ncbi:NeuD/PglB/VioB family sugar acetyltransferase [Dongia deserti]|uniref:NeuD/PglB/VioB family sugar acetyltransferase n=1 Tax=Dongia deserti TaxID=2268030 RepID=UPI000E656149|nr:NeuD/PglB/VioB family sugar acetyltransferase [Dongia deserti]
MDSEDQRLVVIMGAGRHGRNAADIFRWMNYPILGFLDDTKERGSKVVGVEVLGGFTEAHDPELLRRAAIHVAIGNSNIRRALAEAVTAHGGALCSAIHPTAVISPYAKLGDGLFIAPYVRLASQCTIGTGCILDPYCTIGGDSTLGPFSMLAAHCSLVAGSQVGAGSFLGTHVAVLGVSIGAHSVVGAGSVVTRDLPDNIRAFGTPAKVQGPADWSRPPV